jgi:hypothetical protein
MAKLNVVKGSTRSTLNGIHGERNRPAKQAISSCRHQEIILQTDTTEIQIL